MSHKDIISHLNGDQTKRNWKTQQHELDLILLIDILETFQLETTSFMYYTMP